MFSAVVTFPVVQCFILKCFRNRVLRMTSGLSETGGISWELTLCLLLCWIIVFLVLTKGIKSLGKVSCFRSIGNFMVVFFYKLKIKSVDQFQKKVKRVLSSELISV